LLIRTLYLLTLPGGPFYTSPIIDAYWHQIWATEIASGNWQGEGAFFRAPLYPFALALIYRLFGEGPLAPRLFQILLGASTCLLVTWITFRLAARRRTAYIAGAIAALYGTFLYFEGELLIVTMFTFLALGGLAWLARLGAGAPAPSYLGPAFLLGLAAISRPTILIFWPPLLFWLWLYREKGGPRRFVQRSMAVTLALLAPVVAVTAYNYSQSGDLVVVSSQGGVNFYIGNNPSSDGKTAVAPGKQREVAEYRDNVWVASQTIAEQELGRELKASEVSRHWFGKGFRYWRESAGEALGLLGRKTYYFFHGYEIPNNMDPYFSREWSWILRLLLWNRLLFLPFGLIAPLGLLGIALWYRGRLRRSERGRQVASLLILFGTSYAISVILFFVNARFRLPTVPVFIVFAALAVDYLLGRGFREKPGKHLPELALLGVLLLLLNVPLLGVTRKLAPEWDFVTTGVSYQLGGQPEKALEWYERALAIAPGQPQVLGNLGTLYLEMNDLDNAAEVFLTAIERDPAQIESVVNLSSLYLLQSEPEKALDICRRALEIQPGLHAASFNKGRALFTLERYEEAERAYRQALELQPDDVRYQAALAALLMKTGRSEEAIDAYEEVLEADPGSAMSHLSLGISMTQSGDSAGAMGEFLKAHELDPTLLEAPLNIAVLHERAGEFEQAKRWYERTLEIREHPIALLNLGQIYGRLYKDHSRAVNLLERAAELAPENAVVFFNLSTAYRAVGDQQKSRAALEKAVALDPELAERIRRRAQGQGR